MKRKICVQKVISYKEQKLSQCTGKHNYVIKSEENSDYYYLSTEQKNDRRSLFFSSKFTGLLFPRKFYGAQNGSLTKEKDKAGEKVFTNKKKRVLIQPGERRRNLLTNKSNEQSEKYSPLWKCSKLFIPPQTNITALSIFRLTLVVPSPK